MSGNEIINIQVGRCGNYIANGWWDMILKEHALDQNATFTGDLTSKDNGMRLARIHTYFYERGRGALTTGYIRQIIESKYPSLHIPTDVKKLCKHYIGSFNGNHFVPRAVLIDHDPTTIDEISASPISSIFSANSLISGSGGTGNNWAGGYYTQGNDLIDDIMSRIRYETENCDYLQGFQLCHSIGGGTGGGLGSLIADKIKDEYHDTTTQSFTVYPSSKVSDAEKEPYSTVLSMHRMLENVDMTFVLGNEALYRISQQSLKIKEPKYSDLNWLISQVSKF